MGFRISNAAYAVLASALLAACGGEADTSPGDVGSDFETRASDLTSSAQSPLASARGPIAVPELDWSSCGDGFQCATARVPRDYARPRGPTLGVAITRLPARDADQRIGPLFINFGGPGGEGVSTLQAIASDLFGTLNERFDLVAFDPRGVGQTEGVLDCQVDQIESGQYAQPFGTPDSDPHALVARARRYVSACVARNADMLPYVATADVARDMDLLRQALGERQLSYLGFSYGSFLGATYASLFPTRYRALVLDGALDADEYINRPSDALRQQSAAFELALSHFFQACALDQAACHGFGGKDPLRAFDELVARATAHPLETTLGDGRSVDGDDLIFAATFELYGKQYWSELGQALADAERGDGTLLKQLSDSAYGRQDDGTYAPGADGYALISAAEQHYTPDVQEFLDSGAEAWGEFPHTFWNVGYSELPLALLPIRAKNVYSGPFRASPKAPGALIVATTYDPATPYRGSVRLAEELGNAVLLTMQGDGHTAYGGNSSCIDAAVEAYFEAGTLPPAGTVCDQETPFEATQPAPADAESVAAPASAEAQRATLLRSQFRRTLHFR